MHFSVGALIQKNGKYLLIDRASPPFGFAGVAGHIDEGEEPSEALNRELKEESGLTLKHAAMLIEEEVDGNVCSKGTTIHYWYVYGCEVTGTVKRNLRETKSIGWYSAEEIKKLKLEPIWQYWFKKLQII